MKKLAALLLLLAGTVAGADPPPAGVEVSLVGFTVVNPGEEYVISCMPPCVIEGYLNLPAPAIAPPVVAPAPPPVAAPPPIAKTGPAVAAPAPSRIEMRPPPAPLSASAVAFYKEEALFQKDLKKFQEDVCFSLKHFFHGVLPSSAREQIDEKAQGILAKHTLNELARAAGLPPPHYKLVISPEACGMPEPTRLF